MVATPEVRVSQLGMMVVAEAGDEPVNISQMGMMVIANFPSTAVNLSQLGMMVVVDGAAQPLTVSQLGMMVIAGGETADPVVRAWTYSMDGHDFYVLRCSDLETLVCDLTTGQWFQWATGYNATWRLIHGMNWTGADDQLSYFYGSNVLAGDDTLGTLYFLNPESHYDDDPVLGLINPQPFERIVYGQISTRSVDGMSCPGVRLSGDIGSQPDTDNDTVNLEVSDDAGFNYSDFGSITMTAGEYKQRVEWRSLGQITAPGRLFRITDSGSLYRIDGFEMPGYPDASPEPQS